MSTKFNRGLFVASLLIGTLAGSSPAAASVHQPKQPKRGPGGSDYAHKGVREVSGGSGADAWYLFEPTGPRPKSAPLAVITHGYYEFRGHETLDGLIEHTVRKGNVVIYTRWQTGVATPCPGPIDIEPCITSEVAGIKGALAYLKAHRKHVQADTDRTSYFGFSFGGIITANVLNRWKELGVPRPRAMFLDDPHDGGLTGADEPALDDTLAGIPSTTLVQCHQGADGVIAGTTEPSGGGPGLSQRDGSCNAVFPKLTSVPAKRRNIVLTSDDDHGRPALQAIHGVCAGPGSPDPAAGETPPYRVNAYDWGFCWKTFDAMRSCAYEGTFCRYAIGNTPQRRHTGTWSDGTPIIGLRISSSAPVRPSPVPARQAAPPADRRPKARIGRINRGRVRGTATDDDAVLRVQVSVRRVGRRAHFAKARGTGRWSLRLSKRLRAGRYRVIVRAADSADQVTTAKRIARFP